LDSAETDGLVIQAYLKRNDPRDTLVSSKFKRLSELSGQKIGSSSRGRELQLKQLNGNIKVESIRGNIDTIIEKIENGEYDGAILALAGLKVLNLEKCAGEIFSLKDVLRTAGQGIVAIQWRAQDDHIKGILKEINDEETETCALAERSVLKTLSGDCDTAVGCTAILNKKDIECKAQLFSDDGTQVF
jgi:porphobilinogen deaminase